MTPSHAPPRLRLPVWLRRSLYVVGTGCAASGALWLWLHHFGQREGEFGLEPHPWEHADLVLHGTTGLLLLWLAGTLWFPHIRAGWRQHGLRGTGLPMLILFALPAGTAAGLYYLGDETWRGWASLAHWIAGLGAIVWFPVHLFAGRRALSRSRARRHAH